VAVAVSGAPESYAGLAGCGTGPAQHRAEIEKKSAIAPNQNSPPIAGQSAGAVIISRKHVMRGTLGFQPPLESEVIRNFVGKGIVNLVMADWRGIGDGLDRHGFAKVAVANFEP
jgi:hypothetical protein